jgi:hypothetical protein
MVRRYRFGDVTLMYNTIGTKHRFLTSELGPLVSMTQVVTCEYQGRYFVGQGLTQDLPPVFELIPPDEPSLQ